jgi:type III secretory pathway component EscU
VSVLRIREIDLSLRRQSVQKLKVSDLRIKGERPKDKGKPKVKGKRVKV